MTYPAVDVQCFAGGFTYGVASSGAFDVVAKRELPGGFGVASVEANRALINDDLHVEVGERETWTAVNDVAWVFGNPPCSGFSAVSDRATTSNRAASINECMWELVRYAAVCAPPVVAFESVQSAHRNGLSLMRALREELEERTGARYTLYHVLHDAQLLGGAAQRRRYFWLASRIPIGFEIPDPVPHVTLRDAIGDLRGLRNTVDAQPYVVPFSATSDWAWDKRDHESASVDGHVYVDIADVQYAPGSSALLATRGAWRQGRDFVPEYRRYLEEHGGHPDGCDDEEWCERFTRIHNGAWQPKRWNWDRAAYVVTGGSRVRAVHPEETRCLSLRELFRVQGFPDAWLIKPIVDEVGLNTTYLFPGKGIPVESGRWLATMVAAALDGEPRDDGTMAETGDREYTWKRNGNAKPGHPPSVVGLAGSLKTGQQRRTPRKDKAVSETTTKTGDAARDRAAQAFDEHGYAAVRVEGLSKDDAKRAREILYGAAYGMGRKIRMRTVRKAGAAVGVLLNDDGEPVVDTSHAEIAQALSENGELIDPALDARPEQPEAPGETASEFIPFMGFGHASAPYEDGTMHSPGDGTHYRFNAERNDWEPYEVPYPPGTPGVWEFDASALEWVNRAPERAATAKRSKPESTTIECPNPPCRAQVIRNGEGNGSTCWSCRSTINDDGSLAERGDGHPHAPVPERAPVEDNADERESVHDFELNGDADALPEAFEQPKKSQRDITDRRFDLTQLREGTHGYYVHRDYLAHVFRWGWAGRYVMNKGINALDIGCGQDLPLARTMIFLNRLPSNLVCVDLNRIQEHVKPKWLTVYDETDITQEVVVREILDRHGQFDVISNFEVIEHMGRGDGAAMLAAIKALLKPDGRVLLSTPVFNGKAAANHIHEYTIDELARTLEAAGFAVEDRYGTFANYHDARRGVREHFERVLGERAPECAEVATNAVLEFYERCREFYADDAMACFMAPALPDHSRNNVWVLRHA